MAKIRLAVVGGRRGGSFTGALEFLAGRLELTAICDLDPAVRARWQTDFPGVTAFADFDELLAADACDAVVIATPMPLHAAQAVHALEAGKHVLSEVAALMTLEEGRQLIDAVERTGLTYMLAENCCYMRDLLLVREMAAHGVFGDLTVVDCGYIHDCRPLMFTPDGELTWRGRMVRDHGGCLYPTHSLGPVMQWIQAVNPQDRLVSLTAVAGEERALHAYAAHHFGPAHPAAQPGYFQCADTNLCLLRTAAGVLITLRVDMVSPRPWNNVAFVLQGTRGAYHCGRHPSDEPGVWLEATPPPPSGDFHIDRWQSLWDYAEEFESPYWRTWGEQARTAGHGGGDFFTLTDFVTAIEQGSPPPIDVYDAVAWSSIVPLSAQSLALGGQSVDIPDFRAGR